MREHVPCSVRMNSKKMKKVSRRFSGPCPNWAAVRIDGVPFCAAHAPDTYRRLSR